VSVRRYRRAVEGAPPRGLDAVVRPELEGEDQLTVWGGSDRAATRGFGSSAGQWLLVDAVGSGRGRPDGDMRPARSTWLRRHNATRRRGAPRAEGGAVPRCSSNHHHAQRECDTKSQPLSRSEQILSVTEVASALRHAPPLAFPAGSGPHSRNSRRRRDQTTRGRRLEPASKANLGGILGRSSRASPTAGAAGPCLRAPPPGRTEPRRPVSRAPRSASRPRSVLSGAVPR
jgi:hypothetical protein